MTHEQQSAKASYNLLIVRGTGSDFLLVRNNASYSLPSVDVDLGKRIAPQLLSQLKRNWKISAYCLFTMHTSNPENLGYSQKLAVLEWLGQADHPPHEFVWRSRTGNTNSELPENIVRQSADAFDELDLYKDGTRWGPFARPGWLPELLSWTEKLVGEKTVLEFRQLTVGPVSCLIQMSACDSRLWFKAPGPSSPQELPITMCLSKLFPVYVPPVLGVHASWNGWLAQEIAAPTLDECHRVSAWQMAATNLANLQVESIGRCAELLNADCKDLRLAKLIELISPFLSRMSQLASATQLQSREETLTPAEIAWLATELEESCRSLAARNLPDTLGNIDFNPGNVLVSETCCHFLDWAEACVTNPLITLHFLLEHAKRVFPNDPAAIPLLVESYTHQWGFLCSASDMEEMLALSSLVAIFAYGVASDAWFSPVKLKDPALCGYFRDLTRRIYRKAANNRNSQNQYANRACVGGVCP